MLEILVGTIASGKSTYATKRGKQGALIVNDDMIVTALHGYYGGYSEHLKPLYKTLENVIAGFGASQGRDVVVDRALNISKDSRRRWIGLASSLGKFCVATVFPFAMPEEHALRRLRSDARGYDYAYWLRVAKTHILKYEIPSLSEGLDDIRNPDGTQYVWP